MEWSDQRRQFGKVAAPRRRYVHVAQQILAAITQGEYVPGDRLPGDRDIAADTGVSRATVREAILALELIGAVEVRPGDGVYVAGFNGRVGALAGPPLDVAPRELIESRCEIEPGIARLASVRRDQHRLAEVRVLVDRAAACTADAAQLPEFVALGLRFHSALAPCSGNRLLADITGQLVDIEEHPLWTLVNQHAMRAAEAREGQVHEHRVILDAITAGDADTAVAAMRAPLECLSEHIFGAPVSPVAASAE
jgi:DNA-binding FadR family transcriptional regulator